MSTKLKIALVGIVALAAFNLIFFLWTADAPSPESWIGYGFITAAFVAYTASLLAADNPAARTDELTAQMILGQYFGLTLVADIIMMIVHPGVVLTLVVNLLLVLLFGLRLILLARKKSRSS